MGQQTCFKNVSFRRIAPAFLPCAIVALIALPGRAQQLAIGSYHLQQAVRTSATDFDYTYTADLKNSGSAMAQVTGTVASSTPNTVVTKSSVSFGAVASGAAVTSTDTFTIRQDRRFAFDPAALTWSFTVPSSVSLSAASFDFGADLVGTAIVKTVATVTNTGSATLPVAPHIDGDPSYTLVSDAQACSGSLAPSASCSLTVQYLPSSASGPSSQTAAVALGAATLPAGVPQSVNLSGQSAALTAGQLTGTANPQVAQYTINLPFPGAVTVDFGLDTNYGRKTWSQSTAVAGPVTILVAGMLANTTYHIRAEIDFANGLKTTDADHTFATQASLMSPTLSAETTAGATPQPGVEELTFIDGSTIGIGVTDLSGKLVWGYVLPDGGGKVNQIQGVTLLPNGHFLLTICQTLYALSGIDPTPGVVNAVREIDLAGNVVREITAAKLSSELQAAGYDLTLIQFNHDVSQLANGHWLVLANVLKSFDNLSGYPGVTTNVAGDVIVDLDQNLQPVWVWNEFDHLDINRRPLGFPDWTHTNAVVYSPDDGNLLVSIRHQNWVLKIDYKNGSGAGDILWHLGEGGDFKLGNGVDPTDWQYAQHYPSFFSANTTGNFELGVMDNGNDRMFPAGVTCGAAGAPPCMYTTIPVFQIDEGAMTANLVSHQILPANLYSSFGGNTELLKNGNIEYDLAGSSATDSDIFEVTRETTPQTVWHMHSTGTQMYRGYRIPSLYPGVQW